MESMGLDVLVTQQQTFLGVRIIVLNLRDRVPWLPNHYVGVSNMMVAQTLYLYMKCIFELFPIINMLEVLA
jgi:hypothetical protein